MPVPESLSTINQTLRRFLQNPFEWERVCGEEQQLHKALRAAVQDGGRECFLILEACHRLLRCDEAARQLRTGYGHGDDDSDLARWRGNALALIATAQAAMIAKSDSQAWRHFWRRWQRAARDLGADSGCRVPQPNWPSLQSPAQVMEEASRLAREHSPQWPIETLRNWSLYWLPEQLPPAERVLEVPVGVYRSDGSFVARLFLEVLSPETPPVLVEHPLGALQHLGRDLIGVLQCRHRKGTTRAVRWRLVSDKDPTVPIDGNSLDGAAVVAFHCIAAGKPYDRNSLIAALVSPTGEPMPVEEEAGKLNAAWHAGILRACIAPNPLRTEDFAALRAEGMEIVEPPDLAHAVEFATGELARLHEFIRGEIAIVLEDAKTRLKRDLPDFAALTRLLVDVQVARGLRPKLGKGELEALERQRARGDYGGIDQLERRKFDFRAAEAQGDLPEARRTDRWEDVQGSLTRSAVLGDPGFGKTTLLWREVGRRCEEGLAARDVESTKFAVFLRCAEVADALAKHDNLLDAVMNQLRERHVLPGALEPLVRKKLQSGDCVIALDALDEVSDSRRLKEKLEDFARNSEQARILLSSRLAGFAGLPFVDDDDHMEILRLEELEMEQAVRAWFDDDSAAADALWSQTGQQLHIRELLRCPLLLRLACQAAEIAWRRERKIPQWERRADLYQDFLEEAADAWFERYVEAGGQNRTLRGLFLKFAANVALALWKTDARQPMWNLEELSSAAAGPGWGRQDPVKDLEWAGLIAPVFAETGAPRMFTHRTFGEYLCGRALAEQASDSATWKLVDRKAGDPAWDEVIVSMAGELDGAGARKLLALLANKRKDDFVRRRLALAARSLPELNTQARIKCEVMVDGVTTEAAKLSRSVLEKNIDGAFPLLLRSLPATARANGRVAGILFFEWLRSTLAWPRELVEACPNRSVWSRLRVACYMFANGYRAATKGSGTREVSALAALKLVGHCGAVTVRADILCGLVGLLLDPDERVRCAAANTLGRMGAAAARANIIDRLLERLGDREWSVKSEAAEALGQIGAAAARADILDPLSELLRHRDWSVRRAAAKALGEMGPVAAQPGVLDGLIDCLNDPKRGVWSAAAEALGKLGNNNACAGAIDTLVKRLSDPDSNVRAIAAGTLGKLGSRGAIAQVLVRLCECIEDSDAGVRSLAAKSLGSLGRRSACTDIVGRLVPLLKDRDEFVHGDTAMALGNLGDEASRADVLDGLDELLAQNWPQAQNEAGEGLLFWGQRGKVVEALAKLGSGAARAEVISRQLRRTVDANRDVRIAAADVLGRLGSGAESAQVIDHVIQMLSDPDSGVRRAAARCLARFDPAELPSGVLLRAVEDAVGHPRHMAKTLGRWSMQGVWVAKPAVWRRLLSIFRPD